MSFAAPPAAPARIVDWAATDSDDDVAYDSQMTPGNVSPIEPQTEVANRAPPAMADDAHMTPEASPVRELDFSSERDVSPVNNGVAPATPPVRVMRSQEMRVDSAVPYTFKSVWSVTAGPTANHFKTSRKEASNSHHHNASMSSVDRIHNRACEQLTAILRANCGRVEYSDLMKESDWRAKFQPCFGSLFSFLKRNKSSFRYTRSHVELVEEEGIVSELLKVQWRDLKGLTPSDMILSSLKASAAEETAVADTPNKVRSYSAAVRN